MLKRAWVLNEALEGTKEVLTFQDEIWVFGSMHGISKDMKETLKNI